MLTKCSYENLEVSDDYTPITAITAQIMVVSQRSTIVSFLSLLSILYYYTVHFVFPYGKCLISLYIKKITIMISFVSITVFVINVFTIYAFYRHRYVVHFPTTTYLTVGKLKVLQNAVIAK